MGILSWIIIGIIAGLVARHLFSGIQILGLALPIVMGITGALIGGLIGWILEFGTILKFNIISFLFAVAGTILVFILFQYLRK